jgi:hypothetical protein
LNAYAADIPSLAVDSFHSKIDFENPVHLDRWLFNPDTTYLSPYTSPFSTCLIFFYDLPGTAECHLHSPPPTGA